MDPVTFTFPGFRKIINCLKRTMDPMTITFPGFRKICQDKLSGGASLSNDYVIVLPLAPFDKKFNRSMYSAEMTDGRASSEDIDQALKLFEIALSRYVSTWEMVQSIFWRFFLPLIVLIIFDCSYMLRRTETIYFCFTIYCIVGVLYLFVNEHFQNKRVRGDCQGALDFVQPDYMKRGLRWRIPEEFNGRIELIKEYRENEIVSPPVAKANSQYEPPQNIV